MNNRRRGYGRSSRVRTRRSRRIGRYRYNKRRIALVTVVFILLVLLIVGIIGWNMGWLKGIFGAGQEEPEPQQSAAPPVPSAAVTQAPAVPVNTGEIVPVIPTATPDPEGVVTLSTGRKVDTTKPIIAFTFDDGPSGITPRILDAMEENDCSATFFMVGEMAELESRHDTIKRMLEVGCELGNHTMNHEKLTNLNDEGFEEQIEGMADLIEDICGERPMVVRPPWGSVNESVYRSVDYPLVNWTVDPEDWKHRDADIVYTHTMENVYDNCIVLMHDLYESTAEAVERLLPALKEQGYQVVSVGELFEARGIELEAGKRYRAALEDEISYPGKTAAPSEG